MKLLRIVSQARVAQSAERSAVNRKVGGSNPPVSDFFIILFYLLDVPGLILLNYIQEAYASFLFIVSIVILLKSNNYPLFLIYSI